MIRNYLKVAVRNLFRQKFYTTINISGLSIGIAISLLIAFYVYDELSYDKFHTDADRIHQIYLKAMLQGKPIEGANTCAPIAFTSREELAGVADATRITQWRDVVFRYEDKIFSEKKLLLADSNFFSFFTFELLEGNPDKILNEPYQIILTEKTALKYFGYTVGSDESPIGKSLTMGSARRNCEVVGIVKNPPANSHFTFDMIYSMMSWDFSQRTMWTSNSLYSYVKLHKDVDPDVVSKAMLAMSDKYVGPEIEQYLGMSLQEWRDKGAGEYAYYIQPMLDLHLHSRVEGNIEGSGDIAYVYLLSAISIFIILIACINFINLSTARATNRAKEVGIRKTVGAYKSGLINQFLVESLILSFVSTLIAVVLLTLALPSFNQISGKSIEISQLLTPLFLVTIFLVVLIVGLLAGSYPAFYLTSFKPTEVLKGKIRKGAKGGWVRSSLVVLQFTISISLIVSTLVIYKQLKLVQEKNLGFNKENILLIDNTRVLGESKTVFKNRLKSLSSVVNAGVSNLVPPNVGSNSVHFPNGKQDEGELLFQIYADHDFLETLEIKLVEGRYFSEDFPSDTGAVIINKKALEVYGWESIEGNKLAEPTQEGAMRFFEIVGVTEDFNFSSLKFEIEPLAIFLSTQGTLMPVRLSPGNINAKITDIEAIWNEMAPEEPFEYTFVDENFNEQFRAEQRFGKIFILFTSLAIFIASLGLLALATFVAEQRSKEIGIRKALGASVPTIVVLLSKEFTRLVMIAIVISIPAVILLMNWWLQNFAYKTDIGVLSFVLGGVLALILSWFTVSYQSIKAAITNPTNALRYE
ncbi:MAG: ABC transporter permease [Bacteroidota bacterium]